MIVVQYDDCINEIVLVSTRFTWKQEFFVITANWFELSEISCKYDLDSTKMLVSVSNVFNFFVKRSKDTIAHEWYFINCENSYILPFVFVFHIEWFALIDERGLGDCNTTTK